MKLVAICKKCHCRLGVTFDGGNIPDLYCVKCEPDECLRRAVLEDYARQYREALDRCS